MVNGTFIYYNSTFLPPTIIVDLNGFKNPNTSGIDVFYFILVNNRLEAWGSNETGNFRESYTREQLMDESNSHACNKKRSGRWCTALIMLDNWEIKKDYPWK